MILGIGNDIIEIARIQTAIDRYQGRFLDRVFTSQEQAYCQSKKEAARHFAGRFAAKEAVVKALGTGFSQGLTWLDVEILNDEAGKPHVYLSFPLKQGASIMISISHCKEYATAVAVWA